VLTTSPSALRYTAITFQPSNPIFKMFSRKYMKMNAQQVDGSEFGNSKEKIWLG
jgi:hypothetical protein